MKKEVEFLLSLLLKPTLSHVQTRVWDSSSTPVPDSLGPFNKDMEIQFKILGQSSLTPYWKNKIPLIIREYYNAYNIILLTLTHITTFSNHIK